MHFLGTQFNRRRSSATVRMKRSPKNMQMRRYRKPSSMQKAPPRRKRGLGEEAYFVGYREVCRYAASCLWAFLYSTMSSTVQTGISCFWAKSHDFGQTGHGAVRIGHLAQHAARFQTGQTGQVHGRLSVPTAFNHAARTGAKREHMAGAGDIQRFGPPRRWRS